jgi:hypothetical protein
MSNNLNGVRIADNQTSGHHRTANEALNRLDGAVTDGYAVGVTSSNTYTVSATELRAAFHFIIENGATSATAAFTILLPTSIERGITFWRNTLAYDATIELTGQAEPAVDVPAGEARLIEYDGINARAVTGSAGAPGAGVVPATSANSAYIDLEEDTDNGTNKVRLKAPDAIAADATVNLPGVTGDILSTGETKTLTKGFAVTPASGGTVSSGTFTPAPADGNYQYYTNNGAHTLAAPASDCAIDILVTNGASAGAITFSGYTVGSSTGSALTTTNTHKFIISIRRINSIATYSVYALQ